jgi:hypothetical protein
LSKILAKVEFQVKMAEKKIEIDSAKLDLAFEKVLDNLNLLNYSFKY